MSWPVVADWPSVRRTRPVAGNLADTGTAVRRIRARWVSMREDPARRRRPLPLPGFELWCCARAATARTPPSAASAWPGTRWLGCPGSARPGRKVLIHTGGGATGNMTRRAGCAVAVLGLATDVTGIGLGVGPNGQPPSGLPERVVSPFERDLVAQPLAHRPGGTVSRFAPLIRCTRRDSHMNENGCVSATRECASALAGRRRFVSWPRVRRRRRAENRTFRAAGGA